MPDNLRDRIAKILYLQNADEDWNGKEITWEETSKAYRACWLHDAAKLIEALGLKRQDKLAGPWADHHRYVTEWRTDE